MMINVTPLGYYNQPEGDTALEYTFEALIFTGSSFATDSLDVRSSFVLRETEELPFDDVSFDLVLISDVALV